MNNIASRPLLAGKDLDAAVDHARAALAALLRIPGGSDGAGYPKMLAEARALLGASSASLAGTSRRRLKDACPSQPAARERARRRGWGRGVRSRRPARAG